MSKIVRYEASHITFVIILLIVIAFLITEIVSYSRNTLSSHPEWVNGKELLSSPMMGAHEAYETRNVLNRNRLNLDAWHGFNEFLYNRVFQLGSIRFNFYLGKNAYINIIFNKQSNTFSGIRLSRNPLFPSTFFRAKSDGQFIEKLPISNLALEGGWHAAELAFQSNSLTLTVDGHLVQEMEEPSLENQVVGFRSGRARTMVDDVRMKDMEGNLIVREDFRRHRGYWLTAATMFIFLAVLLGAALSAAMITGGNQKKVFSTTILLEFAMIMILTVYFCFDYLYWSNKYHYRGFTPWGREKNIRLLRLERIRKTFFDMFQFIDAFPRENSSGSIRGPLTRFLKITPDRKSGDTDLQIIRSDYGGERWEFPNDDREAIMRYIKSKPLESTYTILFLGTSQTWGAGALKKSDRMVVQVHEILSKQFDNRINFTLINASKSGSNSTELLKRFEEHLLLFQPDLVVINLANNDGGQIKTFANNLSSFVKLNQEHRIHTMFVLEANSPEQDHARLSWLRKMHRAMIEVAKVNDVPWIDLFSYLVGQTVYDSGFLWWDQVHMTSYGQKLAAEFIAQGIMNNFKLVGQKAEG